MRKVIAVVALALASFTVGTAVAISNEPAPASADTVTVTYTRSICFWLVPPGGYDIWYLHSYRTTHLFGGPIHVTQCAFRPLSGLNTTSCRQYVWNGNFTPYWESTYPVNSNPPYCWF